MVMLGRSLHLTTLFLGRLRPPNQYFVHILPSNLGPQVLDSDVLLTALRGPADFDRWMDELRFYVLHK